MMENRPQTGHCRAIPGNPAYILSHRTGCLDQVPTVRFNSGAVWQPIEIPAFAATPRGPDTPPAVIAGPDPVILAFAD